MPSSQQQWSQLANGGHADDMDGDLDMDPLHDVTPVAVNRSKPIQPSPSTGQCTKAGATKTPSKSPGSAKASKVKKEAQQTGDIGCQVRDTTCNYDLIGPWIFTIVCT